MKNKSTTTSKRSFLLYVGGILLLTLLAQVPLIISVENTLLSILSLLLVAIFMGYFFGRKKNVISEMTHGALMLHGVTFLIVTITYQAHALILILNNGNQTNFIGNLFSDWFGFILIMPIVWGLGFLIHLASELVSSRA